MKKISIPTINKPAAQPVRTEQKLYSVYLGEGKKNYFKSNRDARAFVAETNRHLNLWLHQVNDHFAELFGIYRHCWFYFLDHAKAVNRLKIEREINVSFRIIEDTLNKLITNTSGPNGNIFAFNFISSSIDQLLNVAERLKEIIIIRNELVNRYRIEVVITQLKDLSWKVKQYGITPNEKSPEPAGL
jgi:hypothetical protein